MSDVTEQSQSRSNFAELSRLECEKLLAEHSVGRVGLSAPAGPQILPVTYAYYGKTVVFRTSPYGVLSSLERHTRVAFEIDDIDEERHSGWSVLVLGSAERVTQEYTLSTLWEEGPVPWASGTRNLFIVITPDSITGRSVRRQYAD
jgi:nitroimidazol reductase NimA-like FMN-containing flavoprotein (pyridoxamine 5'-phosphate oxidase superfamily)